MENDVRICVVGAGAVGGVVAGVLAREGYRVSLVTKYPDLAARISTAGIAVSGVCGEFTVGIPSVATAGELKGRFDYVLMATKADALLEAARTVLPLLGEDSRVVSMQNGICEELLAGVVGAERTIGCVVGWGATMHAPGKVEMTSGGEFIVGNWEREPDPSLERLAGIIGHIAGTRVSGSILPDLWSKMIINACITTLGAVCGLHLGEMLARRRVRVLFIEVMREAVAVAGATGIRITPGAGGRLDYYRFLAPGFLSGFKRHLFIRVIGIKYRKLKSSSLQSLERGRKTEVNLYNGYISAKGREHQVATPVNDQLTAMVKAIENGQRKITPRNFQEIAF